MFSTMKVVSLICAVVAEPVFGPGNTCKPNETECLEKRARFARETAEAQTLKLKNAEPKEEDETTKTETATTTAAVATGAVANANNGVKDNNVYRSSYVSSCRSLVASF